MIIGEENICKWLELNDARYWTFKANKEVSKSIIAKSGNNPQLAISDSIAKLKSVMAGLGEGQYYMICSDKEIGNGEDSKGGNIYMDYVKINGNGQKQESHAISGNMVSNAIPSGWMTAEQVEEKVNAAISGFQTKMELQKLKDENKQLEKQIKEMTPTSLEARLADLIPVIKPFVPGMLKKAGLTAAGAQVGIAGFGNASDTETETETILSEEEARQRYEMALSVLQNAFQNSGFNFLEFLEKLANKAQIEPENFKDLVGLAIENL